MVPHESRQVECVIPILPVRDLERSLLFYVAQLGFEIDWKDPPLASISRDRAPLMLKETDEAFTPGWVWIGLETDALFEEFRSKGVPVLQEPQNRSWAHEMKFADPDGNILWLGTEPGA